MHLPIFVLFLCILPEIYNAREFSGPFPTPDLPGSEVFLLYESCCSLSTAMWMVWWVPEANSSPFSQSSPYLINTIWTDSSSGAQQFLPFTHCTILEHLCHFLTCGPYQDFQCSCHLVSMISITVTHNLPYPASIIGQWEKHQIKVFHPSAPLFFATCKYQ